MFRDRPCPLLPGLPRDTTKWNITTLFMGKHTLSVSTGPFSSWQSVTVRLPGIQRVPSQVFHPRSSSFVSPLSGWSRTSAPRMPPGHPQLTAPDGIHQCLFERDLLPYPKKSADKVQGPRWSQGGPKKKEPLSMGCSEKER